MSAKLLANDTSIYMSSVRYSLVYEEIDTTDRTHIFDLEIDIQEWKLFRIQRIRLE